jgi:hypothetical protein
MASREDRETGAPSYDTFLRKERTGRAKSKPATLRLPLLIRMLLGNVNADVFGLG